MLCALGLVATYVLPLDTYPRNGEPRIRASALPPAESPAATFAAGTAVLTHRDFEWLQAAAGGDQELVLDLDFLAWYAMQAIQHDTDGTAPVLATEDVPLAVDPAGSPAMRAGNNESETADAPR
jgi:hypothetical protein